MHVRPALFLFTMSLPFLLSAQEDLDKQLRELQGRYDALRQQEAALALPIEQSKLAILRRDLAAIGLPALTAGDQVITHPGHALVYSEAHEVPKWTAHIASTELIQGNLARIDTFLKDPQVTTGTSTVEDYWNSGFDRGHMVPSADMRWSLEALTATYLYSNIAPQRPEFNRGSWGELEDWVRRTVRYGNERVFVVTGPVLRDGLPKMANPGHKNEVSIPELFYKVIADLDGEEKKAIAFVMKNGVNEYPTISYAVPIDSVEKLTGLDFFPALDDATEARLEAQSDPKAWYHEGDPFFGEVAPMKAPLPKGMFNTVQAKYHIGNSATICGTVVSTRRTAKANAIYLNLDRVHPNQNFYATVWDYNGPNFHYDPETFLVNKQVCITGKLTMYDEIPRISVNNENAIMLWEEAVK